jgi:sigma-B regulation protein RsbU (phosphoserine phosphatase)
MYFIFLCSFSFSRQYPRFQKGVGATGAFSTSRTTISLKKVRSCAVSILGLLDRRSYRGAKMLKDAVATEHSNHWTAAREVQQRFMWYPGPATDTLDYSAQCRQLEELGGDFYDFMLLPDNRLSLSIGDASGNGLPAALMISNVQSSLRTAVSFTSSQGPAVLRTVNRQVYGSSLADRYATLFYGVFDRVNRTLGYVNAGHQPPMIIRRDGSIVWLETGGAPVGMFADWTYEEGVVELNPGDKLLACTDGVIEAVNPDGDEWGVDGFLRVAARSGTRSAEDMVQAIFASMNQFSRGCQADDATVMALQMG